MEIRFKVDDDLVQRELKQARRQLNGKIREGLAEGGTRHVLPSVLHRAPSVTRPFLAAKATSRYGYIGTKGSRQGDRITGLLNFGGTVTTPIFPKAKKALRVAPGVIRASVPGPRHYTGQHFIEKGVAAAVPGLEQALLSNVMEAFGDLAE